jgi:hypothetical protein
MDMLEKLKLFALLILSVFLAACSRNLAPTFTPTTSKLLVSTEPTARPSSTPSPLDLAATVFSDLSIDNQRLYSQDGRCTWDRLQAWPHEEASQQKYEGNFYIRATLTCIRGEENKEVNWVLVDEWKQAGLGYSIPALMGWSVDGNYLYFYNNIIPDGCQPLGGFQDNLRRVDLDSGNVHPILTGSFSGLSLSPDTTRLVYYDIQEADVGLFDTSSDEVQNIPFTTPGQMDYRWVGNFTWSPDGQSLLFVTIYGDACFPTGASLQSMDIGSTEIRILFTTKEQTISILDWTEPDRVQISVGPDLHWMDPISGALDP